MSMLEGAPWLVAHKSMLEVNKPKKVSLYGADYVLWQDRSGKINASPNACPIWEQCCLKGGVTSVKIKRV